METKRMHKLEALALVVGPVLALLFFLLEPGAIIIDRAESGDAEAIVTALASNRALTHIAALAVPLGLVMMLYGLTGINRVIQDESMAAALSRLGVLCITIGAIGWILTTGLNHVIAGTDLGVEGAIEEAIPLYRVDFGMTIISGMAVASGFVAFSLGLAAIYPAGSGRVAAQVITAVSVLALIAFVIGHTGENPAMISVARACYFPWVVWSVSLGTRFLKGTGLPQAGGP